MKKSKYYTYLNVQPLGIEEEDCVCRAITLALDEEYYQIQNKLYLIADLLECEMLCVCCYQHLLDDVYKLKRVEGYKGCCIKHFVEDHPHGIYIIRIDGHLTCCYEGCVFDIWDCTNKIIDIIWEVE